MNQTPIRSTIPATMPDLRKAIQDELDRRKWSRYALVQALAGKRPDGSDVPEQTIYRFLRGESPINSDDLGLIFDVFSWKLPPKK